MLHILMFFPLKIGVSTKRNSQGKKIQLIKQSGQSFFDLEFELFSHYYLFCRMTLLLSSDMKRHLRHLQLDSSHWHVLKAPQKHNSQGAWVLTTPSFYNKDYYLSSSFLLIYSFKVSHESNHTSRNLNTIFPSNLIRISTCLMVNNSNPQGYELFFNHHYHVVVNTNVWYFSYHVLNVSFLKVPLSANKSLPC